MLPVTSSLSADTSVRDTILRKAEAALPAAVRERCHAEAEATWDELSNRLGLGNDRREEFVEHLSRNLQNKISTRQRQQILRMLVGRMTRERTHA